MSYLQLEIVDRCFPVQRIQYQKMHLHLRIQCKSTPELSSVHIVIADLQIEHSSIYVDINNWKLMTFSRMYHSWKKCLAVTNMHITAVWNGLSKKYTISFLSILHTNWNTWQKYFSWTHFSTDMIETFWGGKEDASLARNEFLECLDTLELLEKG